MPGHRFIQALIDNIGVDRRADTNPGTGTVWLFTSKQKMNWAVMQVRHYTSQLSWCDGCQAYTEMTTVTVYPGPPYKQYCGRHLPGDADILCPDAPWDCFRHDIGCAKADHPWPDCRIVEHLRRKLQQEAHAHQQRAHELSEDRLIQEG